MHFSSDGFLTLTWDQWQKFKNDPSIKFHLGTLNENLRKTTTKIWAPICGKRPYIVENMTKKELLAYFK